MLTCVTELLAASYSTPWQGGVVGPKHLPPPSCNEHVVDYTWTEL